MTRQQAGHVHGVIATPGSLRGTASAPTKRMRLLRRIPSAFAASAIGFVRNEAVLPGHPLPDCCPIPDSKVRLRCFNSAADCRLPLRVDAIASRTAEWIAGCPKALHLRPSNLVGRGSSTGFCPTRRVNLFSKHGTLRLDSWTVNQQLMEYKALSWLGGPTLPLGCSHWSHIRCCDPPCPGDG